MTRSKDWHIEFQGFIITQRNNTYYAENYHYWTISNTDINKLKKEINTNKEQYFR